MAVAAITAAVFIYFKLKGEFAGATGEWWKSQFGIGEAGKQLGDMTGTTGAQVSDNAFKKVVNDQSQGFYNAALQQYSLDAGFHSTLDGQGTNAWPWVSFQKWKNANYPALPTAGSVTVDKHGVYHNAYN